MPSFPMVPTSTVVPFSISMTSDMTPLTERRRSR